MQLTVLPHEETVFTIQKSCLSVWTVLDECRPQSTAREGECALIQISEKAFCLCKLYFQREIHPSYMYLDTSVVHFKSDEFQSLPKTPLLIRSFCVQASTIQILPQVLPVSELHLSVVVEKISDIRKWRKTEGKLKALVLEILKIYVVIQDSVVYLKNLKERLRHGIHALIVHGFSNLPQEIAPGQVNSKTEIKLVGVTSKLKFEQLQEKNCTSKVGGLDHQLALLKDIVETNIHHKSNFSTLPLKPTKQVLLSGPPGCGKTSLVRQVASECGAVLLTVLGADTISSKPGSSEEALRKVFNDAEVLAEEGLCILLLDEVDSLCPRRDSSNNSSHSVRVTVQLLSLLEKAHTTPGLIIIATTSKANLLDPSIRRPGRLDTEVFVNVPNQIQRESIMKALLDNMDIDHSSKSSVADYVASITPGYVGADLVLVCQEVALQIYRRGKNTGPSDSETKDNLKNDFKRSISKIKPSALRSGLGIVLTTPTSMDSIGGLKTIKKELRVSIEWPLTHPDSFTRMGLPLPKGILLYGPPGCAKTTVARALASATKTSFLSVSAADLFSPYVGEAERSVAELFHRARFGAPTILFIDELDALVGCRGHRESGAQERVLSALLTEMDGIGIRLDSPTVDCQEKFFKEGCGSPCEPHQIPCDKKKASNAGVIVIAATNRPDMIDSALLRPGRFDKLLYVPAPNLEERLEILRCVTRNMPLDGSVDLKLLAENAQLYSGADLANLCKEAALCALSQDGMSVQTIKQEYFTIAFQKTVPSLTEDQIKWYENFKSS